MSIRSMGLFYALENEGLATAGPESEAEATAELAMAESEIGEQEAEINELDDAIGSAQDDVATLEEIADVVEDSLEDGEGLDETAAQMLDVVTESIYRRLGVQRRNLIPAIESFGSRSSRATATRVALEGILGDIKAFGKKIWEAIKKFFKEVGDWFDNIFGAVPKLRRKYEEVKKKVDGLKDTWEPKTDPLENKSVGELYRTGSTNIASDIATKLTKCVTAFSNLETTRKSFETAAKYIETVNKDIEAEKKKGSILDWFSSDGRKKLDGIDASIKSAIETAGNKIKTDITNNDLSDQHAKADKTIAFAFTEVGGLIRYISTGAKQSSAEGVKVEVGSTYEREGKVAWQNDKTPALSREQMSNLLGSIKDTIVAMENYKKVEGKTRAQSEKLILDILNKALDYHEDGPEGDSEDDKKKYKDAAEAYKANIRSLQVLSRVSKKIPQIIMGGSVKWCSRTLDYVSLSANHTGEAKAAAAATA